MEYKTALPLLIVAVALMAGCLGGVDAEEVRDNSLDAMEEVETYEYEMDMDMEMSANDTPGSISMSMDTNGSVDEGARRMSMFSTISSFGVEFGQEAYVINDTMYMSMDMGGAGLSGQVETTADWFKIENDPMVSQTWESSNYAEQYEEILEISDVEYEEDQSVDGENAYVLTLNPNIDDYNQLLLDQMGDMSSMEGMEGMDSMFNEDSINITNVSLRYWISEETGYILRTQSNTTMTMDFGFGNQTDGGFEGGFGMSEEMTVTMNSDIRLSQHGEEVSIELPEGAEDAEEFDSLFPQEGFDNFSSPDNSGAGLDQAA